MLVIDGVLWMIDIAALVLVLALVLALALADVTVVVPSDAYNDKNDDNNDDKTDYYNADDNNDHDDCDFLRRLVHDQILTIVDMASVDCILIYRNWSISNVYRKDFV